jgi:ribosomal protein S27E
MDRKYLSVLLPGALLIAATAWLTYPPSKPKSIGDPSKFRYMHCPECSRESMYSPAGFEKQCPYCEKSLVGTEQSIKQTGNAPNPFSQMFMLVFVELIVVMACVWYVGRPRPHNPDDEFLYINCGKCKQRIRYRVEQVGLQAMCRRCKHAFRYPDEE